MIQLNMTVSYPGLTPAEEARLLENLRRQLQPFVAQVCCSMQKDATGPDWDNAEFLRSVKLDIATDFKVA